MQNCTCTLITGTTDWVPVSQAKNLIWWTFRIVCHFSPSFNSAAGFPATLQEGEKEILKRKESSTVSYHAFITGMKFILVPTDYEQGIFLILTPILMNIWNPKSTLHCYMVAQASPGKPILPQWSLLALWTRANYYSWPHFYWEVYSVAQVDVPPVLISPVSETPKVALLGVDGWGGLGDTD